MATKSVLKIKLTKTMWTEGGWKIVYSGDDEGMSKGNDRVAKGGKERYYVRFLYLCTI